MVGMQTPGGRRREIALATVLTALALVLLASLAIAAEPSATAAGTSACAGADTPSADTTVKQLRKSIRCRINEERAVRGTGKLTLDRRLQKAAQRHAKTMVATGCLAHKCPGEDNLETRIRKAGYLTGADSWQYSENTGCGLSAEAMMANWMASKFHRINILESSYTDIGIGVSQQSIKDRCGDGYATFAVVFGHREP